ncbi:MAG TPA: non-ribosomal peptide synthetase, partial [Pyrinomonadaceae bacterium]|nr:non-ribosomal peptide synthetase [Pyrinomonadaceae bacterium]
ARVINGYGPTEATTFSCCHVMEHSAEVGESVLIGRPIANTQAYVLDENLKAVPAGVAGELYIGGEGLMRGYVNEPELTAQRLVPHPYASVGGERLYRTGDVARWLVDGHLEFIGRADNQVKIRGFRIEPGEVETVLSQHPSLREVAVVARANAAGDKNLFAYVVKNKKVSDDELRDFLAERLPFYMVPSLFVTMEKLPLTPNGKVNRATLPMPEKMRPALDEEFVAPRNPIEKQVAEIWCEVLDIDRVGVNDNFFKLGGHSLMATKVATRVREAFRLELSLGRIFEAPTVAELAAIIEEVQSRPRNISDAEIERMPRLDEDLSKVLAELANLPEQEAQSLLLKEMSADNSNSNK